MRGFILTAVLAVVLSASAAAQPSGRCTHDTLPVHGSNVNVTYCVTSEGGGSGSDLPVNVTATYASSKGSFSQNSTLRFVRGTDSSRVIEDVNLDRLGMDGTLHLTLVLRGGVVRIETAMLTPGAVTIK